MKNLYLQSLLLAMIFFFTLIPLNSGLAQDSITGGSTVFAEMGNKLESQLVKNFDNYVSDVSKNNRRMRRDELRFQRRYRRDQLRQILRDQRRDLRDSGRFERNVRKDYQNQIRKDIKNEIKIENDIDRSIKAGYLDKVRMETEAKLNGQGGAAVAFPSEIQYKDIPTPEQYEETTELNGAIIRRGKEETTEPENELKKSPSEIEKKNVPKIRDNRYETKPILTSVKISDIKEEVEKISEQNENLNIELYTSPVGWETGARFDAYGIADLDPAKDLDTLIHILENEDDLVSTLITYPLEISPEKKANINFGLHTISGTADKGGSFMLLSLPDSTIERDGISLIIVNDAYYDVTEKLAQAFPDKFFIKAYEADIILKAIIDEKDSGTQ